MAQNETNSAAATISNRDLELRFSPKTIAVIGASRTPRSVGNSVMRNLSFGGFTGTLYPVNPRTRSILGVRSVARISDIDEAVDLAIVVLPPHAVEQTVVDCADHNTKHIIVISAGFKEIGGEGIERERRLQRLANDRHLSILGANCLGAINTDPKVRMNTTFVRDMPLPGRFGLISQSGALCTALLDYAKGREIAFS